jgi:hypothetical protein
MEYPGRCMASPSMATRTAARVLPRPPPTDEVGGVYSLPSCGYSTYSWGDASTRGAALSPGPTFAAWKFGSSSSPDPRPWRHPSSAAVSLRARRVRPWVAHRHASGSSSRSSSHWPTFARLGLGNLHQAIPRSNDLDSGQRVQGRHEAEGRRLLHRELCACARHRERESWLLKTVLGLRYFIETTSSRPRPQDGPIARINIPMPRSASRGRQSHFDTKTNDCDYRKTTVQIPK